MKKALKSIFYLAVGGMMSSQMIIPEPPYAVTGALPAITRDDIIVRNLDHRYQDICPAFFTGKPVKNYVHRSLGEREATIYEIYKNPFELEGHIGPVHGKEHKWQETLDRLDHHLKTAKGRTVTLLINSRGGSRQQAKIVLDMLEKSGKQIVVVNNGEAFSMASILAGWEKSKARISFDNSRFLVHGLRVTLADQRIMFSRHYPEDNFHRSNINKQNREFRTEYRQASNGRISDVCLETLINEIDFLINPINMLRAGLIDEVWENNGKIVYTMPAPITPEAPTYTYAQNAL
jgi:ATP-dependent protease ClpP protease subunit